MDLEDIERWDLIRHRLKSEPIEKTFIQFANLASKTFMKDEPEQWHRFCDGNKTVTGFHKDWLEMLVNNDRVGIECAREHLKTAWVMNLILFLLWRNDNFQALYFSATHKQSKNKLAEFEDIWRRNKDWMQFDKSDETWSKFHKKFENGSSLKAEGWGTAVEGAHVQLIIMDDILQERGAMTDKETWQFYTNIISPMSTENGTIVLVGTKKRKGDIFDKVQHNPEWEHARYPDADPDSPIFPEKWPPERLKAKRREMGTRSFNREFGLEVIAGDDVLINPKWNDDNIDKSMSYPTSTQGGFVVGGLDPAISATGDYTAFFVMRKQDDGTREILHVYRKQGMSINEMMMKLRTLDEKYTFQQIIIEQNAFQQLIVNEAVDNTGLPVQGHTTTKKKSDPREGLPRIASLFENGKYLYPYKEKEDIEKTELVHEALNSLKYENGKIQNNHTPDIVMAKFLAEQGIMKRESERRHADPFVVGVREGSI